MEERGNKLAARKITRDAEYHEDRRIAGFIYVNHGWTCYSRIHQNHLPSPVRWSQRSPGCALFFPERRIESLLFQEIRVVPLLHDAPFRQYIDAVGMRYGA